MKKGFFVLVAVVGITLLATTVFVTLNSQHESKTGTVLADAHEADKDFAKISHINQNIKVLKFADRYGNSFSVPSIIKRKTMFIYWASWCPNCADALKSISALEDKLKSVQVDLILVNKLDGTKETVEKAEEFLTQNSITTKNIYDFDAVAYNEIGLNSIPTAFIVDGNYEITSLLSGQLPTLEEAVNMTNYTMSENEKNLYSFILNNMITKAGGMKTNYLSGINTVSAQDSDLATGGDVLSESQGFMLNFTANQGEKDVFDKLIGFVDKNLIEGYLPSWTVDSQGTLANVNATVDDFRIYKALCIANEKWGGYDKIKANFEKHIYEYDVDNQRLVDFYDFKSGIKAKRLTLCYADFQAMDKLAENDSKWKEVYNKALDLVLKGKISDDFPLFHSYYDYDKNEYVSQELNMAEAMLTLYNLSLCQKLPEESMNWVRERINQGAIYARYSSSGLPIEGKKYESTAVYAITALIALNEKDIDTANKALDLMKKFQIVDKDNPLVGAYGNKDGKEIYSFDQCYALTAFQKFRTANN